ncbi:MAG: hypothetical protein WD886_07365 [Burkholderiales bacterium]
MPTGAEAIMKGVFEDRRIFVAVLLLASGPALYPLYGATSEPLFFSGLLLWGLLPLAIAFLIFHLRRYYAAWGWLLAVLIHGYASVVIVRQSESSTAVLDFLFVPAWNIVIVGPVGALVGVLLARFLRPKRN